VTTHDERLDVGAYVLGGLEPDEQTTFEAHLRTCTPCQDEVTELSGLPALLARLSITDVLTDVTPAPTPSEAADAMPDIRGPAGQPIQARPSRRHRGTGLGRPGASRGLSRSRRVLVSVAAAVLIVVAGGIGVTLGVTGGGHHPAATTVALTASTGSASGTVTMTPTARGTDLAVKVTGIPPGTWCSVLLVQPDGTSEQVATWTATYEGTGGTSASTPLRPGQVYQVKIIDLTNQRTLLASAAA
jgi:Putative zinc-finger